jgi:hypothetical protein
MPSSKSTSDDVVEIRNYIRALEQGRKLLAELPFVGTLVARPADHRRLATCLRRLTDSANARHFVYANIVAFNSIK